jgi:hypothetical protein
MVESTLMTKGFLTHRQPMVRLGDLRLEERLKLIASCIQETPHASFPTIFQSKAKLEGFYRFMNNERVLPADLLKSSYEESKNKIQHTKDLVLAIHDTTEFDFSHLSPIEGMGRASKKMGQGFFAHYCIAATVDREILGVLGLKTWTRLHEPVPKNKKVKKSSHDPNNEGARWFELMNEAQKLSSHSQLLHVADREGDDYATLSQLVDQGYRFVIRVKYDRNVKEDHFNKLFTCLNEAEVVCERQVDLSTRRITTQLPRAVKDYPARTKRTAQLGISAKKIALARSDCLGKDFPKKLILNFVRVFELNPPIGELPIEWKLVTSEPIQETADLEKIVDIYRSRWTIEEYFKAIKTGCAFEKRGLESYDALLRCLSILSPIACQIYNLKILARKYPEQSSNLLVTETQIKILSLKTPFTQLQLNQLGSCLLAIASLGGHLKHNGPPGWQVLFRGYEKLLQLEQGFLLAFQLHTGAPPYV